VAAKKPAMPNDCCGMCRFSNEVKGNDYLLCVALPPFPVVFEDNDSPGWIRGGYVEARDPRCIYFHPKGIN